MNRLATPSTVLALMLLLSGQATSGADDTAGLNLQPLIDGSRELFQVYAADDLETPMTVKTVMRWANNTRGSSNGATLLFIHKGRPNAVCCIFPWNGFLRHEFSSLARSPIRAKKQEESFGCRTIR